MSNTDTDSSDQQYNGKIISLPDKLILRSKALSIILIERIGSSDDDWRINRGDDCYVTAKVSDTDFIKKMEEGTEEVARGEYLAVELETTQTLSIQGKLTVSFEITKILQHSLFAKDSDTAVSKK
ncbi:MAG: hypothetical protein LUC43_05550 [Burkholderiales bacterium]|nr:hypothetical protein [Burkholderiales bacterium]